MSLSAVARANKPIPCQHCHDVNLQWRRRRLCWRCYRSRRIRALYEPLPNRGKVGALNGLGARHMDFEGDAAAPEVPTEAPPGTGGKLMAMADRAEKKQELHHPEDTGVRLTDSMRRKRMVALARLAKRVNVAQQAG